ncbi:MAG: response regulator [Parvularculaceae bacterium]|nr:response regulator [Parvularculaceae bacterium]
MADAAKKKRSFRFPLGVKRAVLKPTAGSDGEKPSLQFEPGADGETMENDFDAILQKVMAATDPAKSSLSDEDNQQAAAIAKRLAEGGIKKSAPAKPAAPEPAAEPQVAAKPALDIDDDDLAEPADIQKLIQARESMASLKPIQPFSDEPPAPSESVIKPFADDEPVVEEPELKPFGDEAEDAKPELKPLPTDDEEESAPLDTEMLRALFADRLNPDQLADDDDSEDDEGPTSGGGDGGSSMAFAASPLPESVDEPPLRSLAETLTPVALWLSITALVGSLVYGVWQGGVDVIVAGTFGAGLVVFATILIAASASKAYSPILLAGFLFKRVSRPKDDAVVLAGHDILQSLGLAEGIIDADADARLVTSRDGVVVYANDAYLQIAEQAGIRGATGLPPRIDRLFGQSGVESSKMFRLAKACRSGTPCEEEVTQAMGRSAHDAKGELPVRRFLVSVRPMRPVGDGEVYAAWRLQELEVARQQDTLKAAFASFPRAVVAVERSGSIAWTNNAADTLFGTKAGQPLALSDVVLGEVKPLIGHLWEPAAEEHEARIRDRVTGGSTSIDVVLTPFVKGGAGEGFICVEVVPKTAVASDQESLAAGSDLTDAPFGVAVLEGDPSADGRVTYVNSLFKSYFPAASDGARFQSVLSGQAISELMTALKAKQPQKPLTKPIEVRVGEGAQAHTFRLFARPVRRRRGTYGPRQTVLYAVDITYQRRMEEDHVQGQKLQQIGQIAGSVAHDFNNLLVVVMGSTELLMRNHPVGDPSYKDLSMIYETAQRAQNLTRNLLAFSRKQTLKPEVCSLTELLNDFTPALKRYVSEKVSLKVVHGRNVPEVKADKGQIHLAIMNLAVNARDAMPGGGSVTIETKHIPGSDIADYGYEVLDEVDHVLVEVADTGGGVPADIAEKIFEPFFTTKGEGQGTGLGLSTVAGTIAQMGGRVFLFNRPGEGATFRIFLPAVTEEEAQLAAERRAAVQNVDNEEAADPTGKGRILVVEDEDGVRSIVVRALGMCGYEIVEACDGDEALELIEEDDERFDLVLTDIMMPEMDGPTLIQEAGDKLKGAKVVFMSGYAEAAMREKLNTIEGAKYLQKPFTLTSVAAVVKESLTAR